MSHAPRFVVGAASVCAITAAVVLSLAYGTGESRAWLTALGFVAIVFSITSVVAEPRELLPTLVLGAATAMGLTAEDSPGWLMGPVAVLLLIGAELNAWRWEWAAHDPVGRGSRRRLASIARLGVLGLVASLGVGVVARSTVLDGFWAVALASAALAGLGWVILPVGGRTGAPRSDAEAAKPGNAGAS